jgi:uncharacterized Zn finger protein (UPF0148 family)
MKFFNSIRCAHCKTALAEDGGCLCPACEDKARIAGRDDQAAWTPGQARLPT